MIRLKIWRSESLSPYENLAAERYLTESVGKDEMILMLWRNDKTVVIGRNQNCWKECRVSELMSDGGRIARRYSGGGAVYHDGGNLNFSFIAPEGIYDIPAQLSVIAAACARHGINAAVSGRNDILANGAKFSGNAFYSVKGTDGIVRSCHHGCILICADTGNMERYLNVSKEKLRSKGVDSVRSRVVNLASLSDSITPESLACSLEGAFCEIMGGNAEPLDPKNEGRERIEELCRELSSDEWIFGRRIDFTDSFGKRFGWGEIELCFEVSGGMVKSCKVFSDSMDPELADRVSSLFTGKPFSAAALSEAAESALPMEIAKDVGVLLKENI